jgi:hypothetical protein
VWLASLLSLCQISSAKRCGKDEGRPSVIDQGPRTEPDGHWPRHPRVDPPALEGVESREVGTRLSLAQAREYGDALWNTAVPVVVHLPLGAVLDDDGNALPSDEVTALADLLKGHADRNVLVEVHGLDPEPSEDAAKALLEALEKSGVPKGELRPRGLGHRYPLLPTDGLGGEPALNRRVEVRILSGG